MKKGLVPMQKKEYGIRSLQHAVYLHNDDGINYTYAFIGHGHKFVILEIDTSKLMTDKFTADDDYAIKVLHKDDPNITRDDMINKLSELNYHDSLKDNKTVVYNGVIDSKYISVSKIISPISEDLKLAHWVDKRTYKIHQELFVKHGIAKIEALGDQKPYLEYIYIASKKNNSLMGIIVGDRYKEVILEVVRVSEDFNDDIIEELFERVLCLRYKTIKY